MSIHPLREGGRQNQILLNRLSPDQMLLDNSFEDRGVTGVVPGALRVNQSDRPLFTDSKAIRFGPVDPPLFGKPQLFQALLEVLPGNHRAVTVTAFVFALVTAEKDMPACIRITQFFGDME